MRTYPRRIKKFEKGVKITEFDIFVRRLNKKLPFYYVDKFMAAGFIEHWPIVQIKNAIRGGLLYCAEKTSEYITKERKVRNG